MQKVFSANDLLQKSDDVAVPVFIDTTSWNEFTEWAETNHPKLKELQQEGLRFWIFEDEFKETEPELYQRHKSDQEAEDEEEDIAGVTFEQEIGDKLGVRFHREKLPPRTDVSYKAFFYEAQFAYFYELTNREKSERHSEFTYLTRRAAHNSDKLRILTAQPAFSNVKNVEVFYLGSLTDARLTVNKSMGTSAIFGNPLPDDTYRGDVFMVMPFADKFTPVYEQLVKPTVEELGLSIKRGDDPMTDESIMLEVWSMIHACKVVIADCTDLNANVFYEIGIAHSIGKQVVTLIQDASQLPFDIRHRRAIVYNTSFDQVDGFKTRLKDTLRTILNLSE